VSDAVKYFKKHGYRHCKSACMQNGWLNTGFWVRLKRLVESHELVEECGGLDKAKERVALEEKLLNPNVFYVLVVSSAIDDVESCQ